MSRTSDTRAPGPRAAGTVDAATTRCFVVIGSDPAPIAAAPAAIIAAAATMPHTRARVFMRSAIVHKKKAPVRPGAFSDRSICGLQYSVFASSDLIPQGGATAAHDRTDQRTLLATHRCANARTDTGGRSDDDRALLHRASARR